MSHINIIYFFYFFMQLLVTDDQTWAIENIPLFESSNHTLDLVYYFRWRSYRSHIHPTNNPVRF